MAGASSSHPPPFDSPPSTNLQNVEENKDEDDDDKPSSLVKIKPQVLNQVNIQLLLVHIIFLLDLT